MISRKITNVTADAYKKQRKRKSYILLKDIFDSLNVFYSKYCKKNGSFCEYDISEDLNDVFIDSHNVTAVDGSKYSLLKDILKNTKINSNDIKSYQGGKCVNLTLSTFFCLSKKSPTNVFVVTDNNEIGAFLKQLDKVNTYNVFLFDRNYFCQNTLTQIINHNCDAVFRLSANCNFVREFAKSKCDDKIIYLKKSKRVKFDTVDATKVRLIKYTIKNETYVLCTTLLDKNIYSYDMIKYLYNRRWDGEEFYKILNSNLLLKISNAKTLETFQQSVYAKAIVVILSRIFNLFALKCPTKLKENEHINFSDCTQMTMENILYLLLYKDDSHNNISEIYRIIQSIRKSTVICLPDRHYLRVAIRTMFKWYYTAHTRGTHKGKDVRRGTKSKKKDVRRGTKSKKKVKKGLITTYRI